MGTSADPHKGFWLGIGGSYLAASVGDYYGSSYFP